MKAASTRCVRRPAAGRCNWCEPTRRFARGAAPSPLSHGFGRCYGHSSACAVIERLSDVTFNEVHVWRRLGALGCCSQGPQRRATQCKEDAVLNHPAYLRHGASYYFCAAVDAGFIGSHTAVALLESGYDVVIVDNLVNSRREAVRRVEQIAGRPVAFYGANVCDATALEQIFDAHPIKAAIHFAALKAVGESVARPIDYCNNLDGLLVLLDAMRRHGVKRFVFSSSATVYGVPERSPIDESFPLSATNPYGQTKLMAEQILRDVERADPEWRIAILRYFNPVGAHESGLIGEDPAGIPNNLMPYVAQVAVGKLEKLRVFGDDYDTPDGTGVRDYIHVVDLARGHTAALDALAAHDASLTVNLGTGRGYSVLEVVRAFEAASGRTVSYEIVGRRPGDVASCFASTELAERLLGWRTEHGIERMCADHWRWQSMNPQGFV
jgi:UDP-glucose 4-epimerase